MALTFSAIEKVVLTGNQTNVSFQNIPTTFNDLVLLISGRADITGYQSPTLKFNNTTSNRGGYEIYVYNSINKGAGSMGTSIYSMFSGTNTTSTFGSTEIYIPDYLGSRYKSTNQFSVAEANSTSAGVYLQSGGGLWSDTTAINRIDIDSSGFNMVSGTRFDLYGIKRA